MRKGALDRAGLPIAATHLIQTRWKRPYTIVALPRLVYIFGAVGASGWAVFALKKPVWFTFEGAKGLSEEEVDTFAFLNPLSLF